jgi:hypothetical protein
MAAGNRGIRVVPSMVVQEDTDAYLELNSTNDLDALEIHPDGIRVKARKRIGKSTLLTLSFHGRVRRLSGCCTTGNVGPTCISSASKMRNSC